MQSVDYEQTTKILTFPACAPRSCVDIPITDDCIVEEDVEKFIVHLRSALGQDSRIRVGSANSTVNITDDDRRATLQKYVHMYVHVCIFFSVIRVGLEQTSYTVMKDDESVNGKSVSVCANITHGCYAAFLFLIPFKTRNDSAGIYMMTGLLCNSVPVVDCCPLYCCRPS